ncbi:MAG: guanylate kinase [Cyclobacteriaceae bacterium]|jgi:guanylate kinase
MSARKAIIVAAPSGSGKTTIVKYLLKRIPQLQFSISATSRERRGGETDKQDYYFLSKKEMMDRIEKGDFVEWEEVYSGSLYGTLKSEVERIWADGKVIIFDVDVKGAIQLKKYFKEEGLSIFIKVQNISELEQRLKARGTENIESLKKRIEKVESEMVYQSYFDVVVNNDVLETAKQETEEIVKNFINQI